MSSPRAATAAVALFTELPGTGVSLAVALVPAFCVAVLVTLHARATATDHAAAWSVGTFLAGLGNGGLGSVVVALLYLRVRD